LILVASAILELQRGRTKAKNPNRFLHTSMASDEHACVTNGFDLVNGTFATFKSNEPPCQKQIQAIDNEPPTFGMHF